MPALADSCIGSRVGGNGVRSSGVDGTLGLGTTGGGSDGAVGVRASSGVSSGPFGTCRVQNFGNVTHGGASLGACSRGNALLCMPDTRQVIHGPPKGKHIQAKKVHTQSQMHPTTLSHGKAVPNQRMQN